MSDQSSQRSRDPAHPVDAADPKGGPPGDPAPGASVGLPEVAELAQEVAGLRDLFQRRLLEDQSRQRMYDELYRQLEFARQGLADQFVAPLAREILLVVDRIDVLTGHRFAASDGASGAFAASAASAASAAASEDAEGAGDGDDAGGLASVRTELLEILHRRGLREVDAGGQEFDPRVHEAVARVPVEQSEFVGRVVEVRRPGYALADRLLRPAQVGVGYLPGGRS